MDSIQQLQAMGLELPSPAYLFGALMFGLIGLLAFRHGRRQQQPRRLYLGLALMLYPYLVSSTVLLYLLGALMCGGLYWAGEQT
ncbi:hypothetical protein DBR47_24015 [Paucibacter sp. KBW04]|uniref:hypothetical protein n=1 Tax=Paucibacter sp. KBW04 TaxID=2153361 RepID=UPI000F588801|nr:hypothetical protein [Paucibacter sp. KBW04]RQO53488.1 hypothetical protein DBR47_24015 [Paucibacter sp. KBW04]